MKKMTGAILEELSRGYKQVNRKIIKKCDSHQMENGLDTMRTQNDIYLRVIGWEVLGWFNQGEGVVF